MKINPWSLILIQSSQNRIPSNIHSPSLFSNQPSVKNSMASSSQMGNYTHEEDICWSRVYLDTTQDPITGIYQSIDQFWSCVEESYNTTMPGAVTQSQSKRSLQSRTQIILQQIGSFGDASGKFSTWILVMLRNKILYVFVWIKLGIKHFFCK